ncbi:uncharacterized protein LOC128347977 isoform X1 [Hemicordylus capensis]|uniref:uncharacterized protein LOC128347977 isoform X1 n=1 Tax=Hemicordylus capensis TaxID=884348 RepID=UPI00230246AA|nr:uncharacterized protein LOC128347977 isoform X1 [Hemicordylus capensis]XP_053159372.1 uncharacterized protein LOC128347977 isoform X1 [Hemicordylus capensis]XP_053159382.1 uncharacterized protein LOC128347977 isoform X1 [Hemicordylus capensis]XP_053159391.1 uncharacterized protein LOC128347977 isoform X1 [Hemicordylus capensis]XP_053159401.1 uncharacterized protein LOC128347977 isoform X1 [Hemicordylus capensis]XP_053159412.1 uncharacterized protein LOC128347977 isoform X1 [Hemicordylus cap
MGVKRGALLDPLWVKGPSPIKLDVLEQLLLGYPNQGAAALLNSGFKEGFRIPSLSHRVAFMADNLKSVRGMELVVARKIGKEVAAGRVTGPFDHPPFDNLRVSPLGVVPKKAPGEYRLIDHLSYPRGGSVNDGIPEHLCSVHYTSFDAAVHMVRSQGVGALMAKCDIESAFRLLPVHPNDFDLLGFSFAGQYYFDRALPMGCSISCAAFEAFSTFLEWAIRERSGSRATAHYLDDFLFSGSAYSNECHFLLQSFIQLANELGVPLARGKTEGPVAKLSFLGIELDTVVGCSRLPLEKLATLRGLIGAMQAARKVSLKELQVVVGHLNFACRVVVPGREFLRRLCDLMSGLRAPHHRVRLTEGVRADLAVWGTFLQQFNGVSFWRAEQLVEAELQVHSDAAGGAGFGIYFRRRWCYGRWPDGWERAGITRDLTFLELFPIVVAVHLWAGEFSNSTVQFWCDNQAVVQVVNSQTSRSPRVMGLVRTFVLQCLRANILFVA